MDENPDDELIVKTEDKYDGMKIMINNHQFSSVQFGSSLSVSKTETSYFVCIS